MSYMSFFNIRPGLKSSRYIYSEFHSLLSPIKMSQNSYNICADGANLTITCLSMNRVSLTEKLIRSIYACIPNFKGIVLIVDNGSDSSELSTLKSIIKEIPLKIELIELGSNYGVSGGRNKTLDYISTDWAMMLDNDIYFINNPLPKLECDIAELGCHFINMSLLEPDRETLFSHGGNLYIGVEGNCIRVGADSVCLPVKISDYETDSFLSTFLFGGASTVNINTLKKLGGYDENMFIGFEDIDLSIRIFREGLKIGNCGAVSLVHDHPKPNTESDILYEQKRFTREILKKSADYLEKKYGMIFWSAPIDDWLEGKHQSLGVKDIKVQDEKCDVEYVSKISLPTRPKIALIIDAENWAFANIANQLVSNLSHFYDFTIIATEVVENISQVIMMTREYDITHFFWRESLRLIYDTYYINYNSGLGYSPEQYADTYLKDRIISSSVYDHLFLSDEEISKRHDFYNSLITAYTVSSSKLWDIYTQISSYPKPTVLAEDGVDLSKFYPDKLERFVDISDRDLIIGWAGNSKWAAEKEDFKGYNSLLKPAVEILQKEGLKIVLHTADRQLGFIPHDEMIEYYNKIDLYVCPSKIEGTPNPVLESMACGVPVISTDVGVVRDAFGPLQQQWILEERSLEALINKLRDFYNRRNLLLSQLSAENIESIKHWGWDVKSKNFKKFFDLLLQQRN